MRPSNALPTPRRCAEQIYAFPGDHPVPPERCESDLILVQRRDLAGPDKRRLDLERRMLHRQQRTRHERVRSGIG